MARRKYTPHIATVTSQHFNNALGLWVKADPILCHSDEEVESTVKKLKNHSEHFRPNCKIRITINSNG